MKNRIITLTTDFGLRDACVGVMKGVILGINPDVQIVDLSHEIEPQNIVQAAYLLNTAWPFFPDDTIHVVVVDPGVGSARKAVMLKTSRAFFIAPDNGVLGYLCDDSIEAVNLENYDYQLIPVSNTFHGRDVFAPAAAHLSLGVSPEKFGESITSFVKLPLSRPEVQADGTLTGQVIHIDRFGNLITNIDSGDIPDEDIQIEVNGYTIYNLSSSYAGGEERLAIVGSDGKIQIAVRNGNAADLMKTDCGDFVKIGLNRLRT